MTDSEAKAHIIVPLSRKVGIRATTHIAQSWRSVIYPDGEVILSKFLIMQICSFYSHVRFFQITFFSISRGYARMGVYYGTRGFTVKTGSAPLLLLALKNPMANGKQFRLFPCIAWAIDERSTRICGPLMLPTLEHLLRLRYLHIRR